MSIVVDSQNEFMESSSERPQNEKLEFLEKIVARKARNLLNCIMEMDKMKWFEELRVENPSSYDI